ncbi:MAG TPA: DUF3073 family protein, partial [Jiangellaceae bacterium]
MYGGSDPVKDRPGRDGTHRHHVPLSVRVDDTEGSEGGRQSCGRPGFVRGGRPMGRGRAKAKQTKVARRLKYQSLETDFEALQRELQG